MDINCTLTENRGDILFAESECSDGMCCFTCVIPSNNEHVGFFKSLWKGGTGWPHVKLLVMSEGYKNELYDSCKFLDFIISGNGEGPSLKMDLRCSIYKARPKQCMEYPDKAGESHRYKISGPCIFNEYAAPGEYNKLVYKREWQAFYVIRDSETAIREIFINEETSLAREKILKAKDVRLVSILEGKQELDYILIPIPKQTRNILYSSETHKPITATKQAFYTWQEKY
jgi:Fe-S-cluster containining protein